MSQNIGFQSKVESYLDLIIDGKLIGWARDVERPNDIITLELYLGSRRILLCRADRIRPDLVEAGLGSGRYGFEIAVPSVVLDQAKRTGERLTIRTDQQPSIDLFSVDFNEVLDVSSQQREFLARKLNIVAQLPAAPTRFPLSEAPTYSGLLTSRGIVTSSLPPVFAYAEYIRRMRQLEDRFAPERIGSDTHHFIRWYIDNYNAERAPRRAPLSREVIHWLNEPVVMGGSSFPVTRVMLWYLSEFPQGLNSLDNAIMYRSIVYWWACEKALTLNIEDCLVSRFQISYLRQVSRQWIGRSYPLSNFMEEALIKRPSMGNFDAMHSVSSRVNAYMTLVTEALDEPGLLRFVPKVVLDRLFSGITPLFDTLATTACAEDPTIQPLDARIYRERLLDRGFDLDALVFLSIDRAGHRSEVARLGGIPITAPVDVQLIGPLSKISGLAHAARQSHAILKATGLSFAIKDFVIDNPQPEQYSEAKTPCVAARVNLIHLNADMLPLVYAYLPDLYVGAYTIGFFFWEMDHPADCHELALDLVDEVWVASEYNRKCFAAWTDKPVVNVGMAIDIDPIPDRHVARAELEQTGRAGSRDFVFLTTYDSLSYISRKNPLGVLKAFQAAFCNETDVRLIVKTHNAGFVDDGLARRVWDELLRSAADDPRVVVIDETLPYHEVIALKAASDCYVSLHRSEGFGFGMLESMRLGVPVVCTAYSGNLDFCDDATAWLVDVDEVGVRHGEYAYVSPGHHWAEPRHDSAVAALRGVKDNTILRTARAAASKARAMDRYSIAATAARYSERLRTIQAARQVNAVSSASGGNQRRFFKRFSGLT